MMILYHYTAEERLAAIMAEGLTRGDVPIVENAPGLNAVWLTSDLDTVGHGLGESRAMTDAERLAQISWTGLIAPEGARWLNKRAVRITVRIPSGDAKLKRWVPWATPRMDPEWLWRLNQGGGGEAKAAKWWVYFGAIPVARFAEVARVSDGTPIERQVG